MSQAGESADQRFSLHLDQRLAASLSSPSSAENLTLWPAGIRGAANAFVAVLGSSPGKPSPGEKRIDGEGPRPTWDHRRQIGKNAGIGTAPFGKGNRRNPGWNRLFTAAFGQRCPNPQAAIESLTAIWNLDWRHEALEEDTSYERLRAGAADILSLAAEVKPRVIVTITAQVAEIFAAAIAERNLDQAPFGDGSSPTRPRVVWFPTVPFPTLLLRSIRHPSYNTLTAERLLQVSECCDRFLAGDGQ
jgi:hypothetical protein